MYPDVFLLARSKKKKVHSHTLELELRKRGVNIYRVTPYRAPKYNPARVRAVVNYGCSTMPDWACRLPDNTRWFNHPIHVSISANKINTARWMDIEHPNLALEWSLDYNQADAWLNEGHAVVVRHLISSHSGRGVQIVFPEDERPWDMHEGKMYTKLYRAVNPDEHVREYRFYIVDGRCVEVAEKRRYSKDRREMLDIPDTPYTKYVRTNANGWVYARNTMSIADQTKRQFSGQVEQFADTLPLHFGAVDCIARLGPKDADGFRELIDWKVVEPNTAVGLKDSNTLRVMCDELAYQLAHTTNRRAA